jgi:glycosyltransferase involved in cell wall biosynthesis
VYSKTAGIHGHLVEEQIGKAVDPTDLDDVKSGILQVANDLELISGSVANKIEYFNWQSIAQRYIDIYQTY